MSVLLQWFCRNCRVCAFDNSRRRQKIIKKKNSLCIFSCLVSEKIWEQAQTARFPLSVFHCVFQCDKWQELKLIFYPNQTADGNMLFCLFITRIITLLDLMGEPSVTKRWNFKQQREVLYLQPLAMGVYHDPNCLIFNWLFTHWMIPCQERWRGFARPQSRDAVGLVMSFPLCYWLWSSFW